MPARGRLRASQLPHVYVTSTYLGVHLQDAIVTYECLRWRMRLTRKSTIANYSLASVTKPLGCSHGSIVYTGASNRERSSFHVDQAIDLHLWVALVGPAVTKLLQAYQTFLRQTPL